MMMSHPATHAGYGSIASSRATSPLQAFIPVSSVPPLSPSHGTAVPYMSSTQRQGDRPAGSILNGVPASHKQKASRLSLMCDMLAPLFCELVGTFFLVLAFGCCSICGSKTWNATSIALALMVLVYAAAALSGANFNPAVSISFGLCRKLEWLTVGLYILVQVVGGLLAGTVLRVMFLEKVSVGPVAPSRWEPVAIVEIIYTATLCFVVLNCMTSRRNNPAQHRNEFYGLAIGFVFIAGGYASGEISGSCFNPAVSLSLDITSWHNGIKWGVIYSIYQVIGAVLGSGLFIICQMEDFAFIENSDPQLRVFNYVPSMGLRAMSEFLGTFVLMLTVGLGVVQVSSVTPWSAGAALACMMYSVGSISGGHFNPAVTVAVVLSGRMQRRTGFIYIVVQIASVLPAALAVAFIHRNGPSFGIVFGLKPKPGHYWPEALFAELAFTCFLAYVFLVVYTVPLPTSHGSMQQQTFHGALAIGACVAVGGFAIGAVSGGSLNPAISLGLALEVEVAPWFGPKALPVDSTVTTSTTATGVIVHAPSFLNFVWYALLELIGGAIASAVFHCTHAHLYRTWQADLKGAL